MDVVVRSGANGRRTVEDEALAALAVLRHDEGWLRASAPGSRFASLFGRDALISALQVLPVDPRVAEATLERLGRELGRRWCDDTEEEPGKVLHEANDAPSEEYVEHGWPVRDGRLRYWGSIDAGCWYVLVAAALRRWGHSLGGVERAVREVVDWLVRRPAPLTYDPRNRKACLAHHGWRDVAWDRQGSGHGVVDERGRPMQPPVALSQVAALAWRAIREAADVFGLPVGARADELRAVWLRCFAPGRGVPAFALHAGRTDRSLTSDLGQVLWTGILEPSDLRARAAVSSLAGADLQTPYGIRSLAVSHPAFRPDGYHTGAVWPFDSWLAAGGLDEVEPAAGAALRAGVVDALEILSRQSREPIFPELYVVGDDGVVVRSNRACDIQAWTVGAAIAIARGWDGRSWSG